MRPRGFALRLSSVLVPLLLLGWLGYCVAGQNRPAPAPELPGSAPRQRQEGDFLVSNVPERVTALNPFTTVSSTAQRMILRYTHDALLDLDPKDAKVRPALATLQGRSKDGLVHEFVLRDGVTFSDGMPLTLEDVRFSFEVVKNPGVPAGSLHDVLEVVADFAAHDAKRFAVRLAQPYFAGIEEVGVAWRVMQKKWFLAEVARRAMALGEAVPDPTSPRFGEILAKIACPGPGTGPYELVTEPGSAEPLTNSGKEILLVRSEKSWRRSAYPACWNLAGMRLSFVLDETQEIALLQQQRIDWWGRSNPSALLERLPDLAASYELRVFDSVSNGNYVVFWDCRKPALARSEVRRALTMCFDRRFLVESLLAGQARVAVSWFRPGAPPYPTDEQPLPFDPPAAKELLDGAAQAGAPRLQRLVIGYPTGVEFYRVLLERAVPEFAKAGVEFVVQPVEFRVLLERFSKGELDGCAFLVSHTPWVDPHPWFHSSPPDGSGKNYGGYSNPEVDQVLDAARAELDEAKRLALWRRFHAAFVRDQPATLLAHPRSAFLLHKRFRGVELGAMGLVPERWWVAPEQRLWDEHGARITR